VFEGFQHTRVNTIEAEINVVSAGSGPPVLLLHGFPQTSAMWHQIAPELAREHTVVVPDLRGYGDSSRPPSGADHAGYSFRSMAADQLAVMQALGHESFAVVGHDRGARVAHRLALDSPGAVDRLGLIDVLPTGYMYDTVDRDLATAYYHWFLFIQPEPVPELLMSGDPIGYLHSLLGGWGSGLGIYDVEALATYERAFADPEIRHSMMEDYRAGASIDLTHDLADADRRVEVPTLIMWGARSVVARHCSDPVAVWSERTVDLRSAVIDAGHFLVEERPEDTLAALRSFLTLDDPP
jgi:haloacetate dehalogenase